MQNTLIRLKNSAYSHVIVPKNMEQIILRMDSTLVESIDGDRHFTDGGAILQTLKEMGAYDMHETEPGIIARQFGGYAISKIGDNQFAINQITHRHGWVLRTNLRGEEKKSLISDKRNIYCWEEILMFTDFLNGKIYLTT